ncbi:MAG: response regulator transcription factor [Solirubrobacteraceae bacterium]|nr:response regulator transcription factor [Solirubrobacteraceae bacterium]
MRRVFLCDDAVEYRRLLRAVFEAEPDLEVVGEACDGDECIEQVPTASPDVVLLDLNMPRVGGLAALPSLTEAAPEAQIVVLTSAAAADARREALRLGAHAFLQKPTNVLELPGNLRECLTSLDRRDVRRG